MSPSPDTNDYLADIAQALENIENGLEKLLERLGPPSGIVQMSYAVFRYDTNKRVSGWMGKDAALATRKTWAGQTGEQYVVRSAEDELERVIQDRLNSLGR